MSLRVAQYCYKILLGDLYISAPFGWSSCDALVVVGAHAHKPASMYTVRDLVAVSVPCRFGNADLREIGMSGILHYAHFPNFLHIWAAPYVRSVG